MATSRALLFAALLVLLACIGAYLPALDGPLFFDDVPNLVENSFLLIDPVRFDDWRIATFSNDSGALHRPVAMFTFALNQVVAGELSPLALKATNLFIHCLTAIALYHLFGLLLRTPALAVPNGGQGLGAPQLRAIALLAAAIWLLHPLHVSTVLYVVQRMAQLSSLFVVFGLALFCHYRLRWVERGAQFGELLAAFLWLSLLGLAAVLSKENGVLLPWLIVVLEVFLFRGRWAGRDSPQLQRAAWLALLLPVMLVVLWLLLDPGALEARYARREFTLTERLLTQSRLLWQYLHWLVLPDITSMGFHHDDIPLSSALLSPLTTLLSLVAWTGACLAALVLRARYPLAACALFFYLVAHSIESSAWPLEMVYEHRNYLPAAPLCLLLACGLFALARRFEWLRLRVLGAVLCSGLFLLLFLRTAAWTGDLELARHGVVNHPQSPRANFYYANAMFKIFENGVEQGLGEEARRNHVVAAREFYQRMHALDPRDMAPLVMLYQIDSNYFYRLPDRPDWLADLQALARTRIVQSSDRTALRSLAGFAAGPVTAEERARVMAVLDTLLERYPGRTWLVLLRYQLLAAQENPPRDSMLAMLLASRDARPFDTRIYPALVNHYGTRDLAASYEIIGQWLGQDELRRELGIMRRIFEQ